MKSGKNEIILLFWLENKFVEGFLFPKQGEFQAIVRQVHCWAISVAHITFGQYKILGA